MELGIRDLGSDPSKEPGLDTERCRALVYWDSQSGASACPDGHLPHADQVIRVSRKESLRRDGDTGKRWIRQEGRTSSRSTEGPRTQIPQERGNLVSAGGGMGKEG